MAEADLQDLLGDLPFARSGGPAGSRNGQAPFPGWMPLPHDEAEPDPVLDEFVVQPESGSQPLPLMVRLLFQPRLGGVYDVEHLAPVGSELEPGTPIARLYRVSDGTLDEQVAPVPLVITEHAVKRNTKVVAGDALVGCSAPQLSLNLAGVQSLVDARVLRLAQAVNAVVKGYMGAVGQSGQIAVATTPIAMELDPSRGEDNLVDQIVHALDGHVLDGDVVVLSEKVFTIAQGRVFPLQLLLDHDPKTRDREGRDDLLQLARAHVSDLELDDLLLADSVPDHPDGPRATAGMRSCNEVAARVAGTIGSALGVVCDVVVSDTDTGLEVREELIGTVTIGATPLGATAGLVLYECMRVANAAEFARGSSKRIPIVICRPHQRRARREGMGRPRGYPGRLDATREALLGFA